MTLSNSRLAYTPELEFLDRALEGSRGARIWKGDEKVASKYRMRCHQARALVRKDNARIYPKDDPRHDVSPYDILVLTLVEDTEEKWWVYAEKSAQRPEDIEVLNDYDDVIEIEAQEVLAITDQSMGEES